MFAYAQMAAMIVHSIARERGNMLGTKERSEFEERATKVMFRLHDTESEHLLEFATACSTYWGARSGFTEAWLRYAAPDADGSVSEEEYEAAGGRLVWVTLELQRLLGVHDA